MSVFFINPFLGAVGGDFESISTVTIGSGGAASVEFTSIASTYQHLQLRALTKRSATGTENLRMEFNSSTTAATYAYHVLRGYGTGADAFGADTGQYIGMNAVVSSANTSIFGATIIDILDYTSTSKNKVARSFSGYDTNGGGAVHIQSMLWESTNAITGIKLYPETGNFAEFTSIALYGIKAP